MSRQLNIMDFACQINGANTKKMEPKYFVLLEIRTGPEEIDLRMIELKEFEFKDYIITKEGDLPRVKKILEYNG